MEQENDSTATSTENVEETGAETSTEQTGSNDLSEIKGMLEQFNSDIGSLKRTVKGLTKTGKSDTPEKTTADSSDILQKLDEMSLEVAGITEKDEVDLYNQIKKETGKTGKDLLNSKYFKSELEGLRTERANANATSNIKGDKTTSSAKDSVAYWLAKGQPPTADQVPDRKKRAEIVRAFIGKGRTNGKTFYND